MMNLSTCSRASLTSTAKLLYLTVRMPNMYAISSCPLPGACVGAPPLKNPIHKTPPSIKYGHQVNCSDKQRKKNWVLTNPRRNKASLLPKLAHARSIPMNLLCLGTSTATPGTPPCSVPPSLSSSGCERQCT
jgi:hypothetical protein